MDDAIPDALRRFILTSIPSVPHLEALLLLRATPQHDWDSRAMAQRLYIAEALARQLLAELADMGMLTASSNAAGPAYRYAPRTPALAQLLDRLAAAYAANLVEISGLIHSRLDRRAQQFADAFTWRKDK